MSQSIALPNFCARIKNKDAAKNKSNCDESKQNSAHKKSSAWGQASLVNHINSNYMNNKTILDSVTKIVSASQSKGNNNNNMNDDNNNNDNEMIDDRKQAQIGCNLLTLHYLTTALENVAQCDLQLIRSNSQAIIDIMKQIEESYKVELYQFLLFHLDIVFDAIPQDSNEKDIKMPGLVYEKCQELALQIVNNDKTDKTYPFLVALFSQLSQGYMDQIACVKKATEVYINYAKTQRSDDGDNDEKDVIVFAATAFTSLYNDMLNSLETNKKKVELKFQEYYGIHGSKDKRNLQADMSEEENVSIDNNSDNNNQNDSDGNVDNIDDIMRGDDYDEQEQDDDIMIDENNNHESNDGDDADDDDDNDNE